MRGRGQHPLTPDLHPVCEAGSQPMPLLQGLAEGPGVGPSCRIRGAQRMGDEALSSGLPTGQAPPPSATFLLANLDGPTQRAEVSPGLGAEAGMPVGRGAPQRPNPRELVNYFVRKDASSTSTLNTGNDVLLPPSVGYDTPQRNPHPGTKAPSTCLRPHPSWS